MQEYNLEYVKHLSESIDNEQSREIELRFEKSMEQWVITFQLEPTRYWFLSVFVKDNGAVKDYSIDYEEANDSHYIYKNESDLRNLIHVENGDKLMLHELLIEYIAENGTAAFSNIVSRFAVEEYHYDDYDYLESLL